MSFLKNLFGSSKEEVKMVEGGQLYMLAITLKESATDIYVDPIEGGNFLEKVEELPAKIGLRGKGFWGPNTSYDSGANKWYHMLFTTDDVIPRLSAEFAKLPEVASLTLKPPTDKQGQFYSASVGNQRTVGEFWTRDKAISTVHGVSQPRSNPTPPGFQPW